MTVSYVGEIRMFGGNFAPAGWMFCQGQILPISENDVLFNLIGTSYGGDGTSTFALPDLRGRLPVHKGNGFAFAQSGGVEAVTLSEQQLPTHTHSFLVSQDVAQGNVPTNSVLGQNGTTKIYLEADPTVPLAGATGTPAGGSQSHSNIQPYLCVNFIISLYGIFPSES